MSRHATSRDGFVLYLAESRFVQCRKMILFVAVVSCRWSPECQQFSAFSRAYNSDLAKYTQEWTQRNEEKWLQSSVSSFLLQSANTTVLDKIDLRRRHSRRPCIIHNLYSAAYFTLYVLNRPRTRRRTLLVDV